MIADARIVALIAAADQDHAMADHHLDGIVASIAELTGADQSKVLLHLVTSLRVMGSLSPDHLALLAATAVLRLAQGAAK